MMTCQTLVGFDDLAVSNKADQGDVWMERDHKNLEQAGFVVSRVLKYAAISAMAMVKIPFQSS